MKKVRYALEDSGDFVIENFNSAKAFSSFFPGIAGAYGKPMWAFYVNRGQCISSCGTKDKDGAIMEFYPANQAYYLTQLKGFRTFIKSTSPASFLYEPFRDAGCPMSAKATTTMRISPYKLEITENNSTLGLETKIIYTTVAQEPFAGLLREVRITNISSKVRRGEVIDGLSRVIPYGVNEWCQKHMSRTIEAWMRVTNLTKRIPFYALKVDPEDKPEIAYVDRGNFYLAWKQTQTRLSQLDIIIDPDIVFGRDGDINYPINFASDANFSIPKKQKEEGKTPCAFSHAKFQLKPKQSICITSLLGNIEKAEDVNKRSSSIMRENFFSENINKNKKIIQRLTDSVATKSASNEFDQYTRQTFLDNLLRGGFPYSIDTAQGRFIYYLYARKHGDPERDYNNFMLLPSYFSQGNGAYRDINQNRRNDIFINPDLAEQNIHTFLDALQLDGFSPLLINGVLLSFINRISLKKVLCENIILKCDQEKFANFLKKPVALGDIVAFIEREGIKVRLKKKLLLEELLVIATSEDIAKPGEGYWVDHWTYNLDLIQSYLSVYPEKLKELLLQKKDFTFYESWNKVLSRDEKYVYVDGKVRQYGSVIEDEEKKELIESRTDDMHKVRVKGGKGSVYHTSLLVKLLALVTNKMASLDPFGIGIEMEANKPGWCDALNNLPGIFGSSVSETAELKRLCEFLKYSIAQTKLSASDSIKLPQELASFALTLIALLKTNDASRIKDRDFTYWDKSTSAKEVFRNCVWRGISGEEKTLDISVLNLLLELSLKKLKRALSRCIDKKTGIPRTYYYHKVTRYTFLKEKGRKKLNASGRPLVKALAFEHKPVAFFLEGPVHMMKILKTLDDKKKLYQAIKKSELFDSKLQMYKLNASLKNMPFELGRAKVFTPGWLENESVWLHMEYKYLLELLQGGLYREFYDDMRKTLVAFLNPEVYGRSILENSSFITSSAHPDSSIHGNGFVARLSGSTTEFISMWLSMAVGKRPFRLDAKGELKLCFEPVLAEWLFTKRLEKITFSFSSKKRRSVVIPKNCYAFCFLGKILVLYHNPKRKNTFGKGAVKPSQIVLKKKGSKDIVIYSDTISSECAHELRDGKFEQVEVFLT